ncbi:hypothetical protein PVAP13_9KG215600 [Panicum virgatum]|uniref:Uncharacterized protein n=1 Tax=Panicum virgatum TaxID=38727 RepID=A0A8T0NNM8_PANVG|nr:hypothetical protein PVAP13_9KG215600 [Panicum virgatum]KAG2548786.1 hypothetical protein PVAP13_9KG215600 [Panicum virgatum]
MEQTGLFWGPVQEEDQGLDGFLGDLQFSLASGTACEHQMATYPARDDDALFVLQLLEDADLDEWLSGGLHQSPLGDTLSHHQMLGRKSGRRGMRKRRISPWGVSKFGVGRWTELKKKYFKTSIRTSVHLKDKWRNLLRAYQENVQKYTLLDLEPPLVQQIRKLAAKHPYLK